DPQVFPFAYERMEPTACEKQGNGQLFDFGKELFGKLVIEGLHGGACVYYGESREEALSGKGWGNCTVWQEIGGAESVTLESRAFRYIFLEGKACDNVCVHALFEYLPIPKKGCFSCNDERVKEIYRIAENIRVQK
ncbi:MAG: hypothetical protein IJC47_04525, partial [Alistipes sp.]|nr:hypothetical protein [Alistipes sp.]